MPEIQRVEIETSDAPPPGPAPPSDRVIDLAVGVGQIQAERESDRRELMEVRSELSRACGLIENMSQAIQGLQSQTARVEERAESAQAVAATALEELEEDEGEEGGLLEVVPEVETRVEITQTPVKRRRWIHDLIYGK